MYTVLLVDDEPSVLDSLSTEIHWSQFGVNSVLTASDGNNALELMSVHNVNLLITDIKMPHSDGLTLIQKVGKLYPDTHCILLTAYSEFEYARTAISLGVENYLLKPLNREEMEETIEKALDNIYSRRKITNELFRNNILLRWANGTIHDDELSERANLINVNLYLPEYCVICFEKKIPSLSLSNYCRLCVEQLSPTYESHHFRDEHNRHLIIIGGSKIDFTWLFRCLTAEAAKIGLTHNIAIAVGNVVHSTNNLFESYQTARALIEGIDKTSSRIEILTPNQCPEDHPFMQRLLTMFHQQNDDSLRNALCELADSVYSGFSTEPQPYTGAILTHSLLRLFSQEFSVRPDALEQLNNRIRMFIPSSDRETFIQAATELLEYSYLLFNYYFKQYSPVIQSAIEYIHKHYDEDASIRQFCIKNKMSTAYLGFLFKKETGMFFNNYLAQYRICCSIPLLLDSDLKINDIAQKTGFSSTNYYISCFKKQTGISPNKYRTRGEHK